MKVRTRLLPTVCLPTAVLMFASLPLCAAEAYQLSIPAQPLTKALQAFATQSGLSLVHYSKVTEARMSPALEGAYTPEQALVLLLKDSGLRFVYLNERTIEIRAARDERSGRVNTSSSAPGTQANSSFVLAQSVTPLPLAGQASASAAAAPGSAEENARVELETITVTATRRAESILDVPVSITALSGDVIEARGIKGMGDYLSTVPGVSFIESNSTSHAVVIRGISTSPVSENFGAGTTVATYFGETPITNSAGLLGGSGVDIKLVDIDRVEVLRGPQGTAFGNSSLGGAVRTIPKAPRLNDYEGAVTANYSQTAREGSDNQVMQGVFNAPLIQDRLALRVAGFKYITSGMYQNLAGDDATLQEYAASLGPLAQSLATNSNDMGRERHIGGRAALLFQATDALKLTLTYHYQESEQDGGSFSNGFGSGFGYSSFKSAPDRGRRGAQDAAIDNRVGIANLTAEYAFGWADLVASFSRVDSETAWSFGAGLEAPYDNTAKSPHDAVTGEARLVSKLDGPLQFVAGVFHEKLEDYDGETYGSLEIPSLNPWGDGVNSLLGLYNTDRELTQDAVFGEVSYDILPNLTVRGGVRVYEFERKVLTESSGWFFGTELDDFNVNQVDLSKSRESYMANVTYKPTESTMIYASWSQGFRLGRPAPGLLPAVCDTDSDGLVDDTDITIASTRVIDSDTLDNYEAGIKQQLLGGRMAFDLSVYRIEWNGLPTNAIATCGEATFGYVANAGEARSQGAEFQLSYRVTQQLQLDFGGSFTNAELTTDVPTLGAEKGDRLPASPRWIASLGIQQGFLLGEFKSFVRADAAYRGTFYGDLAQTPLTKAGGYVRVDARAGTQINNVSVELFVQNLTNEEDYVWRGVSNFDNGFGQIMRPRTVGVQLGYTF